MEALLSRFRNLTVLIVVVLAQLIYLGYQVKTNRDERLIRVWAVSAVTPMAGVVEAFRQNTIGFLQDYFILLDVREQNRKLKYDNDRLRMQNVYYRNQLATAEHARALIMFQAQSPSKTIAARVIGNSTVASAKAVFIDRGSTSGIEKGMAVVVPEGIIGKVVSVYPLASQVLLVTDPTFKVGVESQKGHVHGVLDCGSGKCKVEQIQNEEKVDKNEWFYTSGEDRLFPKGFPVGSVVSSEPGNGMRDVALALSGAPGGVEEVLVVLQGVHRVIPSAPPEDETAKMMPAPPDDQADKPEVKPQTEADKVLHKYEGLGKDENHVYGGVGSNVPNFNTKPGVPAKPAGPPTQSAVADAADGEAAPVEVAPKTPAAPAPAPPRPAILGAPRTPATTGTTTTATHPPAAKPSDSNLPLGAPRRKPATDTTATQASHAQQ
ncbi:MAG TPA: rod shape-determining protein MreC [Bryobacteraceae bacterium]|jgi:rod shape-determining protein MreC|nr:rod shape-determining protein MreC [Bryobacteraceae bacterium]